MNKQFICNDMLVVHLTVSQIKAIIESALKEAALSLSKNVQTVMLTIKEVSELTGYKRATIYKLTCERKIPFHKPAHGGRRIFFKREEINQWLESNCIETFEESFKEREKKETNFNPRKNDENENNN